MAEQFNVDRRPHPWGENGVRSSLDEVAKRAAAGALRPEVRTWAIEILDKARKAGRNVNNDRARANEILLACQAKLWVPDPVFAEYIPPARLLACEKHGENNAVCIKGDDCDGLVVLCSAAFMSVGLHSMIVGHAYNREKKIQHVLSAVRINGKWNYADPSTPEHMPAFPLGRCAPFTRERIISVPNVKVLCDDNTCLTPEGYNPNTNGFIDQGEFVGVNGAPEFEWRFRWLGAESPTLAAEINPQSAQPKTQPNPPMTTTEKLMLAGVVVSAAGVIIQLWTTRKR